MKRFLLLVCVAAFVMLQFSCSETSFKPPEENSATGSNDAEKIPCIVNDICYDVSLSTCNLISGVQSNESCPIKLIDSLKLEINDTLHLEIREMVQIPDSLPNVTLDSIIIKGEDGENKPFEIDYEPVVAGEKSYNFATKVTPIDLGRTDIACDDSIKITVYIYAGGKSTTKPIFGKIKKPEIYCKDPYVVPDFTCKWTPGELKYGKRATPSFVLDDPKCKGKIYAISDGDTTWFDEPQYTVSAKNGFPKEGDFATRGVVVCEDSLTQKNVIVIQRSILHKTCEVLKIEAVPEPEATGELSFKNIDHPEGYFIGTVVTEEDIESTIEITNKDDVECGEIEIRITGSPAAAGDTITATAFVICGEDGTEYELGSSISAVVLPDFVLDDCSFTSTSNSLITKGDTLTNSDTLFLESPIKNNYGRCSSVKYSLNGASNLGTSDTLLLTGSNGKLNNIMTRVTCGTEDIDKKCSAVTVVNYAKIEKCHDPRVQVGPGTTIVEVDCYNDDNPNNIAENFGCDCNGGDWSSDDSFSLNGAKPTNIGGCWATIKLPASTSTDAKRRQFLVNYKKEIGCVAY